MLEISTFVSEFVTDEMMIRNIFVTDEKLKTLGNFVSTRLNLRWKIKVSSLQKLDFFSPFY